MTMTMGLTPSHWTAALAQTVRTTSPNAPTWNIVIAVVLLIVATALLGMVIMALRKRLLAKDDEVLHPAGTMEQFRRMHANGEITDQQFEAAKQRFKAKVQKHLQDSPPKRPPVRKAREAAAGGGGGGGQSQLKSPGAAGTGSGTGPGATGSGGQGTNPPNVGRAPTPRPPLPGERRAAPGFDLTGAPLPSHTPPPPPSSDPPRTTTDTPLPPPAPPQPPPTT